MDSIDDDVPRIRSMQCLTLYYKKLAIYLLWLTAVQLPPFASNTGISRRAFNRHNMYVQLHATDLDVTYSDRESSEEVRR